MLGSNPHATRTFKSKSFLRGAPEFNYLELRDFLLSKSCLNNLGTRIIATTKNTSLKLLKGSCVFPKCVIGAVSERQSGSKSTKEKTNSQQMINTFSMRIISSSQNDGGSRSCNGGWYRRRYLRIIRRVISLGLSILSLSLIGWTCHHASRWANCFEARLICLRIFTDITIATNEIAVSKIRVLGSEDHLFPSSTAKTTPNPANKIVCDPSNQVNLCLTRVFSCSIAALIRFQFSISSRSQ